MSRYSAIPRNQGSVTHNGYWERQTPSFQVSPAFFFTQFSPAFMMTYSTEYPLDQLRSELCPLPNAPALPASFLVIWWYEKQKKTWLCVSTAQQYWKHLYIINIVFSTNPNHSSILATMKKINSTPAKISTACISF